MQPAFAKTVSHDYSIVTLEKKCDSYVIIWKKYRFPRTMAIINVRWFVRRFCVTKCRFERFNSPLLLGLINVRHLERMRFPNGDNGSLYRMSVWKCTATPLSFSMHFAECILECHIKVYRRDCEESILYVLLSSISKVQLSNMLRG